MMREAQVPFTFMTNGGGITEVAKAKEMADFLGDPSIDASRMLLSHTPMRALAERFKNRRVIVVGDKDTPAVAASYGFDVQGGFAVTPLQLAAGTPDIYPRAEKVAMHSLKGLQPVNANAPGAPPIDAVLLFFDPVDWAVELQVLADVLAGGTPLGSGSGDGGGGRQAVEVYVSNPDFLWQAGYSAPRYGMGAFVHCLDALWQRKSGGIPLRLHLYGKPQKSQFEAARQMLEGSLHAGPSQVKRIYMMGDNPAVDVRGANGAGEPWRSVLVCTGVYKGGPHGNDPIDPAWRVEPDLRAADVTSPIAQPVPSGLRRLAPSHDRRACV